ncbi:MAG TPA: sulfatase-like hydrolase/transferase [Vicinamibacterales bacterium]|nr:sulfatase-like hydrolase/transferase [Vicinamibacterales bacterium]
MARRSFRRTLIFASVALGTALSAAGGWRYARASAPVSGPIIVISIDSLRADRLPAYGYEHVKTPAIDMLASNGVVFERAYSHSPQTLPAHAALLTGRLPFDTGVRDNGVPIPRGEPMLPQVLRDRGYSTAAVVSGPLLRKDTGIDRGFDFFDDGQPAGSDETSAIADEREGGESEEIAEHWLNSAGSSRVFLFLHLNEPHKPYSPPERFSQYAPYDGEIAHADEVVGRLIHYLKTHQLYDRSTIVLLADHGEGLGDHGEQGHGLLLYDEAVRIPLIVKQESNAGAGRRVTDIVQHVDVMPTILDLAKAPIPDELRGESLKPLLEGTGRFRERSVYSETLYAHYHFGWGELTAITDGRYRYIRAPRPELYDLRSDPAQRENLAAQDGMAQALTSLSTELERLTADVRVEFSGPTEQQVDPKDKVEAVERYRNALELIADNRYSDAVAVLQGILRDEPHLTEIWTELANTARLIARPDLALDAYRHITQLEPGDPTGLFGAAEVLLKERRLDEARTRALEAAVVVADDEASALAAAHQLLARIELARRDAEGAREQADLAQQADPGLPLPAYVEARILYDQGKYEQASRWFERAVAADKKPEATPIPDLYFYAGDALARLNRHAEAEALFAEELREFPRNVRARAGLATLYHATGQPDMAASAISDMLRAAPTPESYTLAARLWTSFGNVREAQSVRAEARRTFSAHQ